MWLQLAGEMKEREFISNLLGYLNNLSFISNIARPQDRDRNVVGIAVVGKAHLSMPLPRRSWSCLASVLPFHDMAANQLAGSSVNFAILHELKAHVAYKTRNDSQGSPLPMY